MLDSIYDDIKITLESYFWYENIKISLLYTRSCYGRFYILKSLKGAV